MGAGDNPTEGNDPILDAVAAAPDGIKAFLRSLAQAGNAGDAPAKTDSIVQQEANNKLIEKKLLPPVDISNSQHLDQIKSSARESSELNRVKEAGDGMPASQEAVTAASIKTKHGVDVVENNGKYEYHLKIGGKDDVLLTTEKSDKGLQEAERWLKIHTEAEESVLSHKYGVEFSKDNEYVCKQDALGSDGKWYITDHDITARAPTLKELESVKLALEHSVPSTATNDGKGIKFYFLNESRYKGQVDYALYTNDIGRRSSILISPPASELPPTENSEEVRSGKAAYSLEYALTHELAHNSWHQKGADNLAVAKRLGAHMGFEACRAADGSVDWVLHGRDGNFYRQDFNSKDYSWLRCDRNGHPLDGQGRVVVDEKQAEHVAENKIMNEIAPNRPPSNYFQSPVEMYAEGLRSLRLNESSRAEFLSKSPNLYSFFKQEDQAELTKFYGVNSNGQPLRIRAVDGSVVPNTEENREAIARWEAAHKAQMQ